MELELSKNTQLTKEMPTQLALAIDKAYNTSSRSGVGWVLSHDKKVLSSHGSLTGYPASKLLSLLRNTHGITDIYLSGPPHPLFISALELAESASHAGVKNIHYPEINAFELDDFGIQSLFTSRGINVFQYDIGQASTQIHYGPCTLLEEGRPWVTCITGADLSGRPLPLAHFSDEFGANSYIKKKVSQAHSLAVQTGYDDDTYVENYNRAGGEIAQYKIDTATQFENAVREQSVLQNSTMVLLADMQLIQKLLYNDMVDEIIYHIGILEVIPSKESPPYSHLLPKLPDWLVTSGEHFDRGSRVNIRRRLSI